MEDNKPIHNEEEVKPPNNPQDAVHEKQLNNPSTDEPIVPAETTAEAEQPQIEQSEIPMPIGTINPIPQTKNMEVHHHAHDPAAPHHKKNWKSYFWEFLMLFLAVTLGFFVENQREHYVEGVREKKYLQSLVSDLMSDTASFSYVMKKNRTTIRAFDSVIHLLRNYNKKEETNQKLYSLVRLNNPSIGAVKINYTAFDQMRTSGNLRLIHDQDIIDSINNYYFHARDIERNNDLLEERFRAKVEFEGKIFDGEVFQKMMDIEDFKLKSPSGNPLLVTSDKAVLNEFAVINHYLISILLFTERSVKNEQKRAIGLINFLVKKYNIKLN